MSAGIKQIRDADEHRKLAYRVRERPFTRLADARDALTHAVPDRGGVVADVGEILFANILPEGTVHSGDSPPAVLREQSVAEEEFVITNSVTRGAANGSLPSGATKMLAVLARGIQLTRAQTATLAGLKARGGHCQSR
jgi:hypothetical protein